MLHKALMLALSSISLLGGCVVADGSDEAEDAPIVEAGQAAIFGGHRYTFNAGPKNWFDAAADCRTLGCYLVTINSPEEENWLASWLGTQRPGE